MFTNTSWDLWSGVPIWWEWVGTVGGKGVWFGLPVWTVGMEREGRGRERQGVEGYCGALHTTWQPVQVVFLILILNPFK